MTTRTVAPCFAATALTPSGRDRREEREATDDAADEMCNGTAATFGAVGIVLLHFGTAAAELAETGTRDETAEVLDVLAGTVIVAKLVTVTPDVWA